MKNSFDFVNCLCRESERDREKWRGSFCGEYITKMYVHFPRLFSIQKRYFRRSNFLRFIFEFENIFRQTKHCNPFRTCGYM